MSPFKKAFAVTLALTLSNGLAASQALSQTQPTPVNGTITDDHEQLANCEADQTCAFASDLTGESEDMAFPTAINSQIPD
ncbi:hypothetical protein [Phaeobacter sp. B1627]|uniref:hypothetical protein n=1 Tax=Phaeobacter sp. B1627 TaxID=2583809 RepID=UPI00111A7819|nr:hypothetical protein [Phaeobacter sp. B1627]TNJ41735.1 hypothetical protein FGE21_12625 [Phaeobacter sp. B1627]